MVNTTILTVYGVDYIVDYVYIKGYPATLEEPGEDADFEIESISVEPDEDNQKRYLKFLDEESMLSDDWLKSDDLHDAVLSELWDSANAYTEHEPDYDDYSELYWDDCYCERE